MTAQKTERVDFTDVKWTMLVTLYHRALESRTKDSILRDHAAAEAIDRIDHNFSGLRMRSTSGDRYTVVLRAKQLDEWAIDFLTRHPDATVLQMGCGLDSRAFRLAENAGGGGSRRRRERGCGGRPPQASMDLPPDVRWFDVDLPEVIEVRRRLYTEHANYRMLASSVTEEEWLDEVPADRPTLIIAEGLLMYLDPSEVERLLRRLTDRFPTGELLFDGVVPWVVRITKFLVGFGGFRMSWSIGDGRELERRHPRLRYVTTVSPPTRYAEIPVRSFRVMNQLVCKLPALRDAMRVFHFAF